MEELLKEILDELKKTNHKLYESDTPIKVTIGEDAIADKVIETINSKNRIQDNVVIKI